jgi:hypothetical protein
MPVGTDLDDELKQVWAEGYWLLPEHNSQNPQKIYLVPADFMLFCG